ncbi:angiopoietin-4 [Elysia marginata]|uniref:Angiopoietin-4 n=1 Tax=Elysia marginata TaxID=1093978 RepID=A0AAV4FH86_9GAST|nr:angiopoietin-4 [Elysia marginata]
MDRRLSIATVWLCFVAYGQGVDLTLARGVPNTCGVLTCREDITATVSSPPGYALKSLLRLSLVKKPSNPPEDQQDLVLGSVSSQDSNLTRVSSGRNIHGRLESGLAILTVDLVKHEDCRASFVCHVVGLDQQGREAVSSVKLVQQNAHRNDATSREMVNLIQKLVESLENTVADKIVSMDSRIEDKLDSTKNKLEEFQTRLTAKSEDFETRIKDRVKELQRDFTTRRDSLKEQVHEKLNAFETRIEDKIEGRTKDRNNSVVGSQNMLTDMIRERLERFQERQKQSMDDICPQSANKTTYMHSSLSEHSDSQNTTGQTHATAGSNGLTNERRKIGNVNFYRKWNEYKNGFGNTSGDFWLGNEAIHRLTSEGEYQLRIDLEIDNKEDYAEYEKPFRIGNESDKYVQKYCLI